MFQLDFKLTVFKAFKVTAKLPAKHFANMLTLRR